MINIMSCNSESDYIYKDDLVHSRSLLDARWDICRFTNESDNSFKITTNNSSFVLDITPTGGTPNCVDDGSGTITSQAQVILTATGTGDATYNSSTRTLNLPSGKEWHVRQTSGSCMTHGYDWDDANCTSTPSGTIYIKSQMSPACAPYITNTTCIQITGL